MRGQFDKPNEEGSEDVAAAAYTGDIGDLVEVVDPQMPTLAAKKREGVEVQLYDSGASTHMSPFRERFVTYHRIPVRPIVAANNKVFHAVGMGDFQIQMPNGATSTSALLRDTLHAPEMGVTVVSVCRMVKAGCSVHFGQGSCTIKMGPNGRVIGNIPASANGLFKVERSLSPPEPVDIERSLSPPEPVDILTLHRRLAHIPADTIRALIRSKAVTGLRLTDDNCPPLVCGSCEYAKETLTAVRSVRRAAIANNGSKLGTVCTSNALGVTAAVSYPPAMSLLNIFESRALSGVLQWSTPHSIMAWRCYSTTGYMDAYVPCCIRPTCRRLSGQKRPISPCG